MWKKLMPRYTRYVSPRCLVHSISLVNTSPGRYEVMSVPSDSVDRMAFESLQVMETDLSILFQAGINPTLVPLPSFVERPDTRLSHGSQLLDALSRQPESKPEPKPEPGPEPNPQS